MHDTQDDRELDPREALALAQAARARIAGRDLSPWWYAPLYGLGVGVMVASPALPPTWQPAGVSAGILLVAVIYRIWSRRTGLAVSGYRAGRTRWIAIAVAAFGMAAYALGFCLSEFAGLRWPALIIGAVAGVAAAIGSRAWDAAWRAQLRGELSS